MAKDERKGQGSKWAEFKTRITVSNRIRIKVRIRIKLGL